MKYAIYKQHQLVTVLEQEPVAMTEDLECVEVTDDFSEKWREEVRKMLEEN